MSYEPRGKVKTLIDAMKASPDMPIWSSQQCAEKMEIQQAALSAHVETALRHGALHRRLVNGRCQYSLRAFPAAEPVTASAAWVPPKMVAPRPGSDVRHQNPPKAETPAPDAGGEPAAETLPDPTAPVVVPPEPAAAPEAEAPAACAGCMQPECSEGCAHPGGDPEEEEPEEAVADAFISCRTGEIVLVGCPVDDEGRVTIPADLVMALRRQIAWLPAAREAA